MQAYSPQLARAFALWEAGRTAESILAFTQLAAQNDPVALATLGELKWRGGVMPQDSAQGRELFRRAGEAGHAPSAAIATNLLASGIAGPRDWPAALERLRKEGRTDARRRQALSLLDKMKLTKNGDPKSLPAGERVSESPEVTVYRGLFSAAECDYLRQMAEPGYQPSFVYDSAGRPLRDTIRTSDGSTIHWQIEDPAVHALNRRLAATSGTGYDQGESLQILRYRPGEQYHPHFDYVEDSDNQRILTALVYLNQDYEGGETCFVKTGLKVKGRKGDAVVFRNAAPDGRIDPLAEHAGLPVTSGIKYLASRWICERRWVP
ncbi:2OG-Fe(II) oxygenase [Allosphingosinicella sp.]|jgi:prolyl 4-hydroxylase|uniref:2OG-Fe(II) oxygenase n=1 Tax=Allosphingosinicella sp. TaxID=2823234 RepID=UPI002EF217B9